VAAHFIYLNKNGNPRVNLDLFRSDSKLATQKHEEAHKHHYGRQRAATPVD